MKRYFFLFVACLLSIATMAQADRQFIRTGNRYYRLQNFAKAEAEYRKAVAVNGENAQALYNLGCALMMQQKDSIAVEQFQKAGSLEKSALRKAKVYHNIGVVCQAHRIYGDAIKAYEESLRNNPSDDETRYNLALCKRLQKNQKKGGGNSKEKDKGKDKQNKDQNDKKQQSQKNDQKDKMSKDNAEQLLNAAMQDEKNTQQRIKKAMQQPRSRKLQKAW
ncbi:MAG: tetratricopeptide repeat protein [Prevotella sp.]|nr:tetratricopeptide repeat protein [Prevotella sp.]